MNRFAPLLLCLGLLACGAKPTGGPDGGQGLADRYLPLPVGAVLRYRITDPDTGQMTVKSTTVEAEEDLSGTLAVRVRTENGDGVTVSWQGFANEQAIRYREEELDAAGVKTVSTTFQPFKVRVDESAAHVQLGATWSETYTEVAVTAATGQSKSSAKAATWTVEATDESVTTPAGTFSCLRVRRRSGSSTSDKVYWFAKGVGKVKESGGQLEELSEYSLPGVGR